MPRTTDQHRERMDLAHEQGRDTRSIAGVHGDALRRSAVLGEVFLCTGCNDAAVKHEGDMCRVCRIELSGVQE